MTDLEIVELAARRTASHFDRHGSGHPLALREALLRFADEILEQTILRTAQDNMGDELMTHKIDDA